jgi:3-oxoacyl-[acyl-carrier protein] reductase
VQGIDVGDCGAGAVTAALVTGASRGIGRAIALRLALDGIAVAINYAKNERAAVEVAEKILQAGGRARPFRAEVGEAAQVDAMFEGISEWIGPVSIVVNNAGLLYAGNVDRYSSDEFDAMVKTNVNGVIHCTRAAVAGMRAARDGRIVNISSIAAAGTSAAGTTYYAATKGAVETLTRRFALELGPSGIRVNAVAPGFIVTDMVDALGTPEERAARLANMASRAVLGRVGTVDDIAEAVAFLVSDAARFITGQILTVDGGRTDYLAH